MMAITPTQAKALREVRRGVVFFIEAKVPNPVTGSGTYKPWRLHPRSAMHKNTFYSFCDPRNPMIEHGWDLFHEGLLRLTEAGEKALNAYDGGEA